MTPWVDLVVVALLPLTALITVLQQEPYAALICRGIMGSVAVMFYAAMGAPDVALTEALVGTLLTIILYAITVRSTRAMRLGVLAQQPDLPEHGALNRFCRQYGLTLRKKEYAAEPDLVKALRTGRVDVIICEPGLFPAAVPESGRRVAVVAEHGRWHERKMKLLLGDELAVWRIAPGSKEA